LHTPLGRIGKIGMKRKQDLSRAVRATNKALQAGKEFLADLDKAIASNRGLVDVAAWSAMTSSTVRLIDKLKREKQRLEELRLWR
jgi:hypothetical protein